nr:uncharacterized protein LOC111507491 [Leptinotarsa decemlineata]
MNLPWTNDRMDNGEDWKKRIYKGLEKLFATHVLKIRLANFNSSPSEARGRRKNNMFTQMLMFGLVTAAIIVIPMGFQFLAILGGKALLLAKMALLLTSIQGLKKIATSNYNYGLYSTYGPGKGPWHYDRQWHPDEEDITVQNYGIPEGYSQLLHPRREVFNDLQT